MIGKVMSRRPAAVRVLSRLQYREAIVSSERFQRLAGFRESHEVPMVPANVVHQDLSPWFRSVIIDQGTARVASRSPTRQVNTTC